MVLLRSHVEKELLFRACGTSGNCLLKSIACRSRKGDTITHVLGGWPISVHKDAQHLNVLLGLLTSRPQTTTLCPVPNSILRAADWTAFRQLWCPIWECGELQHRQRHLCGALPMSSLSSPVFCWDLLLAAGPINPVRWEAAQ